MLRTAFTDLVGDRGKTLTAFAGGHTKSLAYVGTALALTGIGTATATAATSSSAPASSVAGAARHVDVADNAGFQHGKATDVEHAAAKHATSKNAASKASKPATSHPATKSAGKTAPKAVATPAKTTHAKATAHTKTAHTKTAHAKARAATHGAAAKSRVHVVKHHASSWRQLRDAVAADTLPKPAPGTLPLADRLRPGSTSGAQAYLPRTAARMANATTIVRQALAKHMGLRSAVIAIATAEQESTLENLSYGDLDSLGLFQQRPSAGWGSPAEVTDPVYAADAFLSALRSHQAADPGWAGQPLWENAQAVQDSGFPYAYAKWEVQSAQIVAQVVRQAS